MELERLAEVVSDQLDIVPAKVRVLRHIRGRYRCPSSITADAGGSNGHRCSAWKHELQQFGDETRVRVHVSHFRPGTSTWNKIEHRLFCHITENWRGKPLRTFETIAELTGDTRTDAGIRVRAELDERKYPKGVTATDAEMDALSLPERCINLLRKGSPAP